jgi:lipoate-protein ligase A
MVFLNLTLPTPAENLACDEALLEHAETTGGPDALRFWESPAHFVVLGYAATAADEVNIGACKAEGIPIYRRCTGGGTVLQGPGCLNYALVLPIKEAGPTASIRETNCFVMERHCEVLAALMKAPVRVKGLTDLTIDGLKFSGNAHRRRRNWLLFHGTFLLGIDLELMEKVLKAPARQPEYRKERRHSEFLMQLSVDRGAIKSALREAWGAGCDSTEIPTPTIQRLVSEKYSRPEWNLRS